MRVWKLCRDNKIGKKLRGKNDAEKLWKHIEYSHEIIMITQVTSKTKLSARFTSWHNRQVYCHGFSLRFRQCKTHMLQDKSHEPTCHKGVKMMYQLEWDVTTCQSMRGGIWAMFATTKVDFFLQLKFYSRIWLVSVLCCLRCWLIFNMLRNLHIYLVRVAYNL